MDAALNTRYVHNSINKSHIRVQQEHVNIHNHRTHDSLRHRAETKGSGLSAGTDRGPADGSPVVVRNRTFKEVGASGDGGPLHEWELHAPIRRSVN